MNTKLPTCNSDDDVVRVDDDDGPEFVHEIGIVRLQPEVISWMEWIVCVGAVDNLPANVLDGALALAVVVTVANVVDDGDEVVRDFVDDNDKSGGGCFDRIMLEFKTKLIRIFFIFDLVVTA